jgi:hypothetical protein
MPSIKPALLLKRNIRHAGEVGFVVDKVALGQVSTANLHSTKFFILTITRGRYKRPEVADVPSGPRLDSTPHHVNAHACCSGVSPG